MKTTLRITSVISLAVTLLISDQILKPVNAIECGIVNSIQYLIRGGSETAKGQWPFVVVLKDVVRSNFFCGGTLIAERHVLTAAHCIHNKNSATVRSSDNMIALFGAYDITDSTENGTFQASVTDIFIHPDWNAYSKSHDADLAILILDRNVTITENIRPVCLPSDFDNILGASSTGTVVGWGQMDNALKRIPRQAETHALNDSYCYATDNVIARFSSNRTFCGGLGDGIPVSGDSGGGFYVASNYIWVQYGIISAIRTNATGHVLPDSIAVYTNVNSFKNWIRDTVTRTGGTVGEAIMKININFHCGYSNGLFYECILYDLIVHRGNVEIELVTGSHEPDKTATDVEGISFFCCSMAFVPNGMGRFLPNLKHLWIGPDLGTKLIMRSNFVNMTDLKDLRIFRNGIEILPEDTLCDLPNLEIFFLVGNKLTVLYEQTFAHSKKLKNVNLSLNNLVTLPGNLFETNVLLEYIQFGNNSINTTDITLFASNANLMVIDLSSNELDTLPVDLFKNNFRLEAILCRQNMLSSLEEHTFESNAKLEFVDFSFNRLELLPENVFRNNSLLKEILLRNNSLKAIDENMFAYNSNLEKIDLSHNQLEVLPGNLFANNSKLMIVYLNRNFIKTIDERTFINNVNLTVLILSINKLEALPKTLFERNHQLEVINVASNFLRSIDAQAFKTNEKLRELYLSINQLESLPDDLFKKNPLLELVIFDSNCLKNIDQQIFETQTNSSLLVTIVGSPPEDSDPQQTGNSLNSIIAGPDHPTISSVVEFIKFGSKSLKQIDEIFQANKRLEVLYLYSNAIQSLPTELFKMDLFLDLNLNDEDLSILNSVNISALDAVLAGYERVSYFNNVCLDRDTSVPEEDSNVYAEAFESVVAFETAISQSCRLRVRVFDS